MIPFSFPPATRARLGDTERAAGCLEDAGGKGTATTVGTAGVVAGTFGLAADSGGGPLRLVRTRRGSSVMAAVPRTA